MVLAKTLHLKHHGAKGHTGQSKLLTNLILETHYILLVKFFLKFVEIQSYKESILKLLFFLPKSNLNTKQLYTNLETLYVY